MRRDLPRRPLKILEASSQPSLTARSPPLHRLCMVRLRNGSYHGIRSRNEVVRDPAPLLCSLPDDDLLAETAVRSKGS